MNLESWSINDLEKGIENAFIVLKNASIIVVEADKSTPEKRMRYIKALNTLRVGSNELVTAYAEIDKRSKSKFRPLTKQLKIKYESKISVFLLSLISLLKDEKLRLFIFGLLSMINKKEEVLELE
jgi:hypothetical protein